MFELIDFIIVRPITNILFVIYGLVGDFGIAIILFTILVKILAWPLMKNQLKQSKLMRQMQPELAEIKKRANGNKQLESLEMMNLYKKYNIKPFRSILTLIIQLPIFIAIYTAIRVMVLPTTSDNLLIRAYEPVRNFENISEIIEKQEIYLADQENEEIETAEYDFHPQLFGLINLDAYAFSGESSSFIILAFAIIAAMLQSYSMKQQMPTGKKKRKFKEIMKEAMTTGKDPDQSEINSIASSQMAKIMPIFMFFIMLSLPGAIVFYYMLLYTVNVAQQKYVFEKQEEKMETVADKQVVRELNKIKEAEVIENKKTGTRITRISAKDTKNKNKNKKSGEVKKRRKNE